MQPQLLDLLAARNGHFRYESGYHATLWFDLDPLFVQPSALERHVAELANSLASYKIDAVCGPVVGGAFLAQLIATVLDVEFYYAERLAPAQRDALYGVKYRIPNSLRKRINGKNVAIVDDVISAGSAVRGAFADVRSCAANPVVIGALLVLGSSAADFFADHNTPLVYTAWLPNQIWLPSECPLCASQFPLEDPTAGGAA